MLIVIISICLYQKRPLVKTDEWKASVSFQDEPSVEIPVYKMWGFPNRKFIELPENSRQRYHWFVVDSLGVSNCFGVGSFPYRHLNHDMSLGISLDDAKLEDSWHIQRDGENIHFSNADFKISVTKNSD